ncbi:MAG TPA: hypothetical protein VGM64_07200 [Lacunisphaera sp.]|jgi:hypothetical protein
MRNTFSTQCRRLLVRALCGALFLVFAGCESSPVAFSHKAKAEKYFTPTNFTGDTRLPVNLHRVVLLPVYGGTIVPPETAASIEEIFATELQKQMRFEVVRFSREDCMRDFGSPAFSSVGALPHDFLTLLGREYAADAVLFIDVTSYQGYRPLVLGIRSKLATVEQTRLLWSFDQIFSADDAAVGNSVRHYYGAADPSGIPVDASHAGLQSPGKFAAYVAAATFKTLPPR